MSARRQALLLIAATLAVFGSALGFGFVGWDDPTHLLKNPGMNPPTLSSVWGFWAHPYFYLYIPLTYTLWALLAAATGLKPWAFHALNITFHLVNVLAVHRLVIWILPRRAWPSQRGSGPSTGWLPAVIAAGFFAVHPMQVESVAWISAFKDLLSGALGFFALLLYLRSTEAGSSRAAIVLWCAATSAFLLGLLSKPSLVVLPLLLLAITRCFLDRPWRRDLPLLAGWLAMGAPLIGLTKSLQPDSRIVEQLPFAQRLFIAGDSIAFYLYKVAIPVNLAFDYGRTPSAALAGGVAYFAALLPLALAALGWAIRGKRGQWWPLGLLLLFAVPLAPVSGLVPFEFQNFSTVADHYVYFSMLAPALGIAMLLSRFRHRALSAAFAGAVIILGILSMKQLSAWRSEEALTLHTLSVNPRSYGSLQHRGGELLDKGLLTEAVEKYREALAIKPGFVHARQGLGIALIRLGRAQDAAQVYAEAFAKPLPPLPVVAKMHSNYGVALGMLGRDREAIRELEEALRMDPALPEPHRALGVIYLNSQERDLAISHLRAAAERSPSDPAIQQLLSSALAGPSGSPARPGR